MTQKNTKALKADARKALERAHTRPLEASEADIQSDIQTALRALGFEPDLESPLISPATGTSKRADILCRSHRLILECKARNKLDIDNLEQQFSQLAGYVESFRRKPEIPDSPLRYAGILTDGHVWFLWTWPARSDEDAPPVHIHQLQPEKTWRDDPKDVLEWLSVRSEKRDSRKDKPPPDLKKFFEKGGYSSKDLWSIWHGQSSTPSALTHFSIWERFMEDSGFIETKEATGGDNKDDRARSTKSDPNKSLPEREKQEHLFIDHCWLILVARGVINALEAPHFSVDSTGTSGAPGPFRDEQGLRLERLAEGLVHWITESQAGNTFLRELQRKIDSCDWRLRPRDILKDLYEALIEKENRKVFGEYYTPDWLAEMLAECILDDAWCESATEKALDVCRSVIPPSALHGIGVLDPACGSGTFLMHAARRILRTRTSTLKGESDETCANVVAWLVHGFDVHPVAVELARATLLRALPARPSEATPIQVYQGDALLRDWGTGTDKSLVQSSDTRENVRTIRTRQGRELRLPRAFFSQQSFQSQLQAFVKTALAASEEASSVECPNKILHGGFEPQAKEQLREAWHALVEICRIEGDGVWDYHIRNFWAPVLLGYAKINRILSNPPWVRLSEIQTSNRKDTFEKMAAELKIWVGGNQATGLDIASIFILQCIENFFPLDQNPPEDAPESPSLGAWLTNNASLEAGNWEKFREIMKLNVGEKPERRHYTLSTAQVREAPFNGAAAAVWFTGQPGEISAASNAEIPWFTGQPGEDYILTMKKKDKTGKISRDDPWKKVKDKLEWTLAQEPIFPWGAPTPSTYLGNKNRSLFRQGATIVPQCLVRVDPEHPEHPLTPLPSDLRGTPSNMVEGTTHKSRQGVWKNLSEQNFEVPKYWIRKVVFSKNLLDFRLHAHLTCCILPLDEDQGGTALLKDPGYNNPYWHRAESLYEDNCGIGGNTPKTLVKNIDHLGKLTAQLKRLSDDDDANRRRVLYNASGFTLRAARVTTDTLCDSTCYWYDADTEQEALYLTGLLNAETLQPAFRASRQSDRHFHTYFWRSVPIPRFDSANPVHRRLVEVARRAESVASECSVSGLGQIEACSLIRRALCLAPPLGPIPAECAPLPPDPSAAAPVPCATADTAVCVAVPGATGSPAACAPAVCADVSGAPTENLAAELGALALCALTPR